MRVLPERKAIYPANPHRVITTASPEFSIGVASIDPAAASTAWFSANDPCAFPFRLSEPTTVKKLGWVNGSAAGGGVDIGVYSDAWVRLVSAGAQTGSGNSLWQWIDVTDTVLSGGQLYYLAMSRDNTTANRCGRWGNALVVGLHALLGTQDSATNAYPLPDPLTNMAAATVVTPIYILGMQCQDVAAF